MIEPDMIEWGGCRRGAASRRVTAATKPACAGWFSQMLGVKSSRLYISPDKAENLDMARL
jgi:hypothetical protein